MGLANAIFHNYGYELSGVILQIGTKQLSAGQVMSVEWRQVPTSTGRCLWLLLVAPTIKQQRMRTKYNGHKSRDIVTGGEIKTDTMTQLMIEYGCRVMIIEEIIKHVPVDHSFLWIIIILIITGVTLNRLRSYGDDKILFNSSFVRLSNRMRRMQNKLWVLDGQRKTLTYHEIVLRRIVIRRFWPSNREESPNFSASVPFEAHRFIY